MNEIALAELMYDAFVTCGAIVGVLLILAFLIWAVNLYNQWRWK